MPAAMTESELLARIALRDRQAFKEFYRLTSPKIFAIALKMLRHRAHAEDLLQDVYLKVWYAADSYNADRGEAMSWLVSMTRNRAIDMIRRRDDLAGKGVDEQPEQFEFAATGADQGHRMRACLEELEAGQRQSIFAAFFQGLTHSEIAERFAEPVGTIKSRVRRGLAALKGCLES